MKLATLDPMISVYRAHSMLKQGLEHKNAQVKRASLEQALRLLDEALAIQEAKDRRARHIR